MKIGIPKEIGPGETRVAVIPSLIAPLIREKHEVLVESKAGEAASFSDAEYEQTGATIISDTQSLYATSDVILKVQPPQWHRIVGKDEAQLLREGGIYVGFLAPVANPDVVKIFLERRVTSFSMEYIPRITRAQSMDALSSMATIAGYKGVLLAASKLTKMLPLMMTAAGTLPPAIVLVLGAGVAGLQATATARRLGAKVEAFDPRPAVKEQVKSLGATFIDMEMTENVETKGGYAKEASEEFLRKERDVIAARLPKMDAVVCTAQVFGKRAPVLITADMVKLMRPGSVIVDLAAEQGGNCELTEAGKTVEVNGISIIGAVNLPATLPTHASQMYSKNITTLLLHLYQKESTTLNFEDDITKGCCITHKGSIVNETVQQLHAQQGASA